jgi:hypothetical protein
MPNPGATRNCDGSRREFEVYSFSSAVAKSLDETAEDNARNPNSAGMPDSRSQTLGGVRGHEFKCVSSSVKDDTFCLALRLVSQSDYQATTCLSKLDEVDGEDNCHFDSAPAPIRRSVIESAKLAKLEDARAALAPKYRKTTYKRQKKSSLPPAASNSWMTIW